MTTATFQRESATIYEFPPRGRYALANQQDSKPARSVALPRVVFGSGWYHDEAIAEERARQR